MSMRAAWFPRTAAASSGLFVTCTALHVSQMGRRSLPIGGPCCRLWTEYIGVARMTSKIFYLRRTKPASFSFLQTCASSYGTHSSGDKQDAHAWESLYAVYIARSDYFMVFQKTLVVRHLFITGAGKDYSSVDMPFPRTCFLLLLCYFLIEWKI